MTTYGDFSSLLQLGVGVGIGLSLFRAPVDIRAARLDQVLNAEIFALRGGGVSEFRRRKRIALQKLRFQFIAARQDLDRYLYPFMVAAAIGALVNLAALIFVSLHSSEEIERAQIGILLIISCGYFLLILLLLEMLARWHLSPLLTDLKRIQLSTETRPSFE